MFMLAAVFLTTCQTVFSEMLSPQSLPVRQTHRNNGPLSIPAAVNHASSVSFTQFGTGTVRMCLPLADQIYTGPALLAALQALQRQFREFATTEPTAEQDRQNGSVTLSCKSLGIGYLPER
jgi:hypothetical protein